MMSDSTERTMPPPIGYASKPDVRWPSNPAASDADLATFLIQLRRALLDYPKVAIHATSDSVSIPRLSPDGPDVTAFIADGRCTLSIGGWHDDMHSLEATVNYVKLAVQGDVRVRIDRIGGKPWQCALERRLEDESWQEESTLVHPRFNLFPRRKTTQYLRNAVPAGAA